MKFLSITLALLGSVAVARALEFARPFGDFMVLPHGVAIPVWGKGEPGSEVRLAFGNSRTTAHCNRDGIWKALLPAEKPTAVGREMVLSSGTGEIMLKDVLVGEVWFFSGQSNMDFPLAKATGGRDEAKAAAGFPAIRLFNLTGAPTGSRPYDAATLARLNVKDHFQGKWSVSSENSASEISAVAWWTAKELHQQKGIPIGVVENAIGGSGAEAWLPNEVLRSRDDYKELLGMGWIDHPKIGMWARGRARLNLGKHLDAMHPFRPGFLFESGVREWAGFPLAGVVWYQGETNAEIPDDAWNERIITDLITGWRSVLGKRDMPFYMVQLPRIGGNDPIRAWWPQFRNVQANVAKHVPGVRMIVTQDIGWDSPDVHPPDKKPVAVRLAKTILER